MKEKTIEITAPEGYEVDKERSSFEKIVFRALPDKLPKKYRDLKEIDGWWVDDGVILRETEELNLSDGGNYAVFPTREEAEASIALAQLCQLRDRYNGGWKPIWVDGTTKFTICRHNNSVDMTMANTYPRVLVFKTATLRDEFKKNFSDLIEKAKPLLG